MFLRVHAKDAAAQLRDQVPGVRRVLIAHTDGLPVHDELIDVQARHADPEAAAAVVAAMLGVSEHASAASGHGDLNSAFVLSDDGCLTVHRIGDRHALAVYAGPTVDLAQLDQLARQVASDLAAV